MDGYTVRDVSFTSKEPGIPVADVGFCLAGGNAGHGVLRAPPGLNGCLSEWLANRRRGWVFYILTYLRVLE